MKKNRVNKKKRERAKRKKMEMMLLAQAGLKAAAMPVGGQCEPAPAGLAALSNTLEIFDKFKPAEVDDKESDEESFHLPMLDDDESESKSTHSSGNKESHNGETEEDILNKFDNVGNSVTPDFDGKNEDSILDEGDDMVDNQLKKNINSILNNLDDNVDSPRQTSQGNMVQYIRVNIEYKEIGCYEENIEDGEFMSKYEFECLDSQCNSVLSEAQPESMVVESTGNHEDEELPLENEADNESAEEPTEDCSNELQLQEQNSEIPEEENNELLQPENVEPEVKQVDEMWNKFTDNSEVESQEFINNKQSQEPEKPSEEAMVDEQPEDEIVEDNKDNTERPNDTICNVIEGKIVESKKDKIEETNDAIIEDDDVEMDAENDVTKQGNTENTEKAVNVESDAVLSGLPDEDVEMQMDGNAGDGQIEESIELNEPADSVSKMEVSEPANGTCLEESGQDNFESMDTNPIEDTDPNDDLAISENKGQPPVVSEDRNEETEEDALLTEDEALDGNGQSEAEKENLEPPNEIPVEEQTDIPEVVSSKINKQEQQTEIQKETNSSKVSAYEDLLLEEPIDEQQNETQEGAPSKISEEDDLLLEETVDEQQNTTQEGVPSSKISEEDDLLLEEPVERQYDVASTEASQEDDLLKETVEEQESVSNLEEYLIFKKSNEEMNEPAKETASSTASPGDDPILEKPVEEDQKEKSKETDPSIICIEDDPLLKELDETIKTPEPPNENVEDVKECSEEVLKDPPLNKSPQSEENKPATEASADKTPDESSTPEDEADLLDISIVRDTEEDDACAIRTAIEDSNAMIENDADDTTDVPTSDKSDDDQAEPSEGLDAEADDSSDDKDVGGMDFDDTSNDCGPPESVHSSDKEDFSSDKAVSEKNKDGAPVHNESIDVDMDDLSVTNEEDKTDDSERTESAATEKQRVVKKPVEKKAAPSEVVVAEDADSRLSNDVVALDDVSEERRVEDELLSDDIRTKSTKRSLSATEEEDVSSDIGAKKIKLSIPQTDTDKTPAAPTAPTLATAPPTANENVKTLTTFFKFMQSKKLKHRLTRSDLEQFCLQKLGELMWHKTSEGELHQTIAKQGQVIEQLRKDMQQLTKQARDLETVNKKLMNELKNQNGAKKPLVPLKITRSVGLQVRLGNPSENLAKRRQAIQGTGTATPATSPVPTIGRPVAKSTSARPRPATPAAAPPALQAPVPSMVAVVRQQSPQKQPPPLVTTNPNTLLSQALGGVSRRPSPAGGQKRATPVRASPSPNAATRAAGGNAGAGVIDLTDEDERKPRPVNRPAKTVQGKILNAKSTPTGNTITRTVNTPGARTVAALPQNVRLTTNQVKNGIAIPSISTSGAQLMYVPLSTITSTAGPNGQKTVFLNLQPTNGVNGVLTNALGNPMSVVQGKGGAMALKPGNSRKHPAALPCPPRIAMDPSLKPVPPKPHLSIRKTDKGIILQWRMPYNLDLYESIYSYQLYAYQETNQPPSTDMWRKVGDVKALALPMACTLTQFADKNKYYFAVRSVDVHKRIGAFSDPEEISL